MRATVKASYQLTLESLAVPINSIYDYALSVFHVMDAHLMSLYHPQKVILFNLIK